MTVNKWISLLEWLTCLRIFQKTFKVLSNFAENFHNDELEVVYEGKTVLLSSLIPPLVFKTVLMSKLDSVNGISISFAKSLRVYIRMVIVRVVKDQFDNYPQLTSYVIKVVEHVILRQEEMFLERVLKMVKIEKTSYFTRIWFELWTLDLMTRIDVKVNENIQYIVTYITVHLYLSQHKLVEGCSWKAPNQIQFECSRDQLTLNKMSILWRRTRNRGSHFTRDLWRSIFNWWKLQILIPQTCNEILDIPEHILLSDSYKGLFECVVHTTLLANMEIPERLHF